MPLSTLHPCEHTTVGDRIEAGTFLGGGALTGGPLTVRGIDPAFLRMAIMKLRAMGCDVETGDDWITVRREEPLSSVDIQTLPHPGFPTDLQAQFMLLAALADGASVVTENVFENRFMFAAELVRMGADVTHRRPPCHRARRRSFGRGARVLHRPAGGRGSRARGHRG